MQTANATHSPGGPTHSSWVYGVMIAAGLARIAMVAAADLDASGPSHSVPSDSTSFRRSVHLVSGGLHALLARHGLALPDAPDQHNLKASEDAGIPGCC